jgi:type VI secretion system secreted protein Hcp
MAIDHYLDLRPDIRGESSAKGFEEQIELESWNIHGANPPDITSAKGGAGTGRVAMGYLECTVKQTVASVYLFERLVEGKHIAKAVLTCRKAGGGPADSGQAGDGKGATGQAPFHQITFHEVYVAHHRLSGSSASDWNYESFTLAFGSIKHDYWTQDKTGKMTHAAEKKWDLRQNIAC